MFTNFSKQHQDTMVACTGDSSFVKQGDRVKRWEKRGVVEEVGEGNMIRVKWDDGSTEEFEAKTVNKEVSEEKIQTTQQGTEK